MGHNSAYRRAFPASRKEERNIQGATACEEVGREGGGEVGKEGTAVQSSSVRVGPPPRTLSFLRLCCWLSDILDGSTNPFSSTSPRVCGY